MFSRVRTFVNFATGVFVVVFLLSCVHVAHADTTSNLVGRWTFDNANTTWSASSTNDVSGNNYTGYLKGFYSSTSTVSGIMGQALSFDGATTSADITPSGGSGGNNTFNTLLSFAAGSPWTFSAWVYSDSSATSGTDMTYAGAKASSYNGKFKINSSGNTKFGYVNQSGTTFDFQSSASCLRKSAWCLLTWVADSSNNVTLYVNGANSLTKAVTTSQFVFQEIGRTGTGACTANTCFKGLIDDTRIYSRALSAQDVSDLYTLGFTPTITTSSATFDQTTATLNGSIDVADAASSTVRGFAYGLTTAYGATTTESGTFGTGSFSANIDSLSSGTLYHFRAYASNATSTGYGSDLTFTTTSGVTSAPTLTTSAPTLVSTSTLTLNANISSIGTASITQSGFAYSTASDLSTVIATTTLGSQSGTGNFTQNISSLTPNTLYYFRAYAVNSVGTSTGAILSTTTLPWSAPGAPTSISAATSSPNQATITFTTPSSNGGSSILYYVASSTPGNFSATSTGSPIVVTGLTNGTSYTFAVYAVNVLGTSSPSSASNAVIPSATLVIPTLTTSNPTSVSTSSMTVNANISSTGGTSITQSGFAYSTVSNLSTVIATTTLGSQSGTGNFTQNISSLTPNTLYYFRAYAVNSVGTSTGAILSTTTTDITPPTISISSPINGYTVSGSSITLTATASDDVGIVGVQFKLDGTIDIGSEVTSVPYSTTWDSTGIVSYSSHTLYAVARDAAGNRATSTVSVNVDNVNIIYPDWRINWQAGVPGGIPVYPVGTNVKDYGAVGDGVTDDYSAIMSAIAATANGTAVYFPEGTYRVNQSIVIHKPQSIVLRGDGPTKTKLISYSTSANSGGTGSAIYISMGSGSGVTHNLTSGMTRGSTNLTLDSVSSLNVGDYIQIQQDNDPSVILGNARLLKSQGQLLRITEINGLIVTVDRPLYYTYGLTFSPQLKQLANMTTGVGVEDLRIESQSTGSHNIYMYMCAQCWVKNVDSRNSNYSNIELSTVYQGEVRDSSITDFLVHQGYEYGIQLDTMTTDTLVENNNVEGGSTAIMLQGGASGNVVSYNYSIYGFNIGYPNSNHNLTAGIEFHGDNSNMNLAEGNVVMQIAGDDTWGSNRANTFFRNWATRFAYTNYSNSTALYGLVAGKVDASNYYFNLVGNVLTRPSDVGDSSSSHATWLIGRSDYANHDSPTNPVDDSQTQVLLNMHGNFDYVSGTTQWNPNISNHTIPSSLYLDSKPSWWGSAAWPAIGPDVTPMTSTIPAKYCYEQGLMPTCLVVTTPNPTPAPVNSSVSSSGGGGSASSQVNNLIAMGNYKLAQQIAKQFGLTIPIQNIPVNTPAVSGTVFTRTLKFGQTSKDVKSLQIFLNAQGFTVSKKGAGSPGYETTYFGPATKAALMKFQLAYKREILDPQGLKGPTGIFASGSMKVANLLIK